MNFDDTRSLAEVEQDTEADDVPRDWRVWWKWCSRTGKWTRHEQRERPIVVTRRLRGSQDYAGLHLGRGTKWIKPKG